MIVRTVRIRPRRLAAVAPDNGREPRSPLPAEVDSLCREWGHWVTTRRLLAPRPIGSVLGQLRTPSSTGPGDGPRVRLDQHVAAFHRALQAQDERGVAVLWGMYVLPAAGVRMPVRMLATAIGIGRSTAYRLRDQVAVRAYQARHRVIEAHCRLGVTAPDAD